MNRLAAIPALILKPGRLVLLALIVAAVVAGLVYGGWIAAQGRAIGALSTAYDTPVLAWVTRQVTGEPTVEDTSVAGVPVTIVRPGGDGPWPAVAVVNGATEEGRLDEEVLRLSAGLARVGHFVVVLDAPGLTNGTISTDSIDQTVRVIRSVASGDDVEDGHVSLVGLGLGGTMALLASAQPRLAARIPVVVAISPLTDFVEMGRFVTTGFHRVEGGFVEKSVPPEIALTAANLVLEALPATRTRRLIEQQLETVADGEDPLARLDDIPDELLDPGTRAVVELLSNDDPRRYDRLFARLPEPVRAAVRDLSPTVDADRIRARVEIATSANDPYVPLAQVRALERAGADVHVTVSDAFSSTQTRPQIGGPGDFFRVDALVVRALREARASRPGTGYIRSGASTPIRSRHRAITPRVARQRASRNACSPLPRTRWWW